MTGNVEGSPFGAHPVNPEQEGNGKERSQEEAIGGAGPVRGDGGSSGEQQRERSGGHGASWERADTAS